MHEPDVQGLVLEAGAVAGGAPRLRGHALWPHPRRSTTIGGRGKSWQRAAGGSKAAPEPLAQAGGSHFLTPLMVHDFWDWEVVAVLGLPGHVKV